MKVYYYFHYCFCCSVFQKLHYLYFKVRISDPGSVRKVEEPSVGSPAEKHVAGIFVATQTQ